VDFINKSEHKERKRLRAAPSDDTHSRAQAVPKVSRRTRARSSVKTKKKFMTLESPPAVVESPQAAIESPKSVGIESTQNGLMDSPKKSPKSAAVTISEEANIDLVSKGPFSGKHLPMSGKPSRSYSTATERVKKVKKEKYNDDNMHASTLRIRKSSHSSPFKSLSGLPKIKKTPKSPTTDNLWKSGPVPLTVDAQIPNNDEVNENEIIREGIPFGGLLFLPGSERIRRFSLAPEPDPTPPKKIELPELKDNNPGSRRVSTSRRDKFQRRTFKSASIR